MLDSTQLEALDRLVQAGTLTPEQAQAVRTAMAEAPRTSTVAAATVAVPPATALPAALAGHNWRDRLIEAAAYAGSALVGVAVVVLVAQNWESLGKGGQIAVLLGLAAVTAVIAFVVAWLTPQRWHGLVAETQAPRRRLASLMLTMSSASLAGTMFVIFAGSTNGRLYGCIVGAVTVVAANLLATSLLTEVGMFGWTLAVLAVGGELLRPAQDYPADGYVNGPPLTWYDHVYPIVGVLFGLAWATLASRWLRQKSAATILGLGYAFTMAMPYVLQDSTRVGGLAVMGVLAALGLWRYLVTSDWLWLVFSILTLGLFMFQLVGGANQPVLGFLVAGLVLLGMSAFGIWRRRHGGGGGPGLRPRAI